MELHPVERLPDEWRSALSREPAFRAVQLFRWIHQRGVLDPEQMSDLPKGLRAALAAEEFAAPMTVTEAYGSKDGSKKLLLETRDGAGIETVLLPVVRSSDDADVAAIDEEETEVDPARVTQCISTQVGCAMGCVFCASGIAGLKRHLSAAEIVSQILVGRAHLESHETLRQVVFMGMGEPLHNYEATARAIRLLTHPDGLALSPRRITVSTSGLVPEIDRLGADFGGKVGLAISLHAADDARRTALVPINQRYPLAELILALRRYPLPKRRRITIEYTLIAEQNDSTKDAKKLVSLLRGLPVKVNLIPMNPIAHSELGPAPTERVHAFQKVLTDAGYLCFIRRRRGDDVAAACGQLVLLGAKPTRKFLSRQPS
jgi:23S rRNA (adenine2503-C2)-methyltransferase